MWTPTSIAIFNLLFLIKFFFVISYKECFQTKSFSCVGKSFPQSVRRGKALSKIFIKNCYDAKNCIICKKSSSCSTLAVSSSNPYQNIAKLRQNVSQNEKSKMELKNGSKNNKRSKKEERKIINLRDFFYSFSIIFFFYLVEIQIGFASSSSHYLLSV